MEKKSIQPKILIVDDDIALCDLYKATLESQGYEVEIATGGEEALTKSLSFKPDLILLDIMMPQIHGLHVLDILKATPETKDVKIIILTALSDQTTMKKAKGFGAVDYIVKSQTDMADVLKRIGKALD